MIALTTLLGAVVITPVSAQATTYTVFPVGSLALSSAAQPTNANALVTLNIQDSTIAYIVRALVHQAGMKLFYDFEDPVFARRTTINVDHARIMNALMIALKGTGLTATPSPDGETILIRGASNLSAGRARFADGVIAGRVIDSASGHGLGGASVKVAGTKLSAVTSDSGGFTLRDVPSGDQVLTVRLFGYKPVDRTVTVLDSQRIVVRVVLVPVPTVLSGVVTTATGVQRRIEVGSDITVLNADSIMRVAPVQTLTDLLETRVPGLTVVHSDGVPGDPSRIRLRGVSSIQLNNDPIVIVDGIRMYASQSDPSNQNLAPSKGNGVGVTGNSYNAPSPLDQIDPNSIETIEVLKGPSASAIYGSDAAAGVIVITTKHGRSGPAQWSLDLGAGVNWLPGSWPTNYFKFGTSEANDDEGLCSPLDLSCRVDSVVSFQALNDPRYTVFSHGTDQTIALTVSGGNQTLQYNLTGSGTGDLGNLKLPASEQARYDSLYGQTYGKIPSYLVRPDRYTTWSGSGSMTANVSPTFKAQVSSALFSSTQQHSPLEGAINELQGSYINPVSGVYRADGELVPVDVPLIQQEFERATDNAVSTTNAITLDWRPAPWLPITATGGANTMQRHDVTYVPFGINDDFFGNASTVTPTFGDTTGSYGLGRGSSQDQTLNVGTTMPLFRHRVNLAVGGNLHTESTSDFQIYTDELAPGVTVPTEFQMNNSCGVNGLCASLGSQATYAQSTYGWYVEPQFDFASKFFAAPGFRLDGGSGGATSAGSVGGLSGFPKIQLSYVAVDRQGGEPLWGVLSLLRPRLTFGVAGTQPGPADKLRLYNVGQYKLITTGTNNIANGGTDNNFCQPTVALEEGTVPAVCLDYLGNTQLRPERSSEIEGGFDATLWSNRVSVTYTQYNKTRHDAILQIPVAPSVYGDGFEIQKNIGEIRNTGVEVTANINVLQTRTLGWNVGAILSNDNNLVVRLNKGQNPIILAEDGASSEVYQSNIVQERVQAGYPLFAEFTRPIVGFADANHDGVIEPSEIVYGDSVAYVGQPNPKYQFNLTSDLALLDGRLTIHAGFAYQNGMTQINEGACASGTLPLLLNQPGVSLATQASLVAANCGYGNSVFADPGSGASAIGLVQRVNTFRFNDLSINYTIPRMVAQWFRVPRMSVALQGSNLALHTNYRGFDPDVNAFSTVRAGDETVDNGQIPEPRTWWLRLTLGN